MKTKTSKNLENIAINRSQYFEKQFKKDKRALKNSDSRNLEVAIKLYEYIENNSGMNRALLADKLNVSQAYICKLINGNVNLTLRTIEKYESILGVTLLSCNKSSVESNYTSLLRVPQGKTYSTESFSYSDTLSLFSNLKSLKNGDSIQIYCY